MSGQCLSPSEPGHALTPGNHRSLGEPLPHQQANGTHAHLIPKFFNHLNMRSDDTMEHYSSFPRGILLYKVGCIRVTHPCAGRQQKQASLLPLDLHVLGLPLAFILSQDQTLHCNVVVCFLAINSRIIDKVFCIPCFS